MMKEENQVQNLETLCDEAIRTHLGDISDLPGALKNYVSQIYRDFVDGYLNLLRQKENKGREWFPERWSVDPELADDMRHFFSDYQHLAHSFFTLNDRIAQLRIIDKRREHERYRVAVGRILAG